MRPRTRPRHRTREWLYGDVVFTVDEGFTDDILLNANQVVPAIGGELRSVCIGHAPSELVKNRGQNTGGLRSGRSRSVDRCSAVVRIGQY